MNWKKIAVFILQALLVLLGGAAGGSYINNEEATQPKVEAEEAIVLNAPLETSNQKGVWLVTMYWNREPKGTTGDIYIDTQRLTITGRPTLENVSLVASPPFEGSKLIKIQSVAFIKYVTETPPIDSEPIDNNKPEEEQ